MADRDRERPVLERLLVASGRSAAVRIRGAPEGGERSGIGRYADATEIGRGGMGVVLRAVDLDVGREVAIKVLDVTRGAPRLRLWRFVREARITGQLEHPNIPPIHEIGITAEGRPYFALRLVRGRSLEEVLAGLRTRGDPAEPARSRARLLGQFLKVCDAVAYAHSRGVVHRDLKPANVMIGEFGEVLVLDWGVAKVVDEAEERPEVEADASEDVFRTRPGDLMGTPIYMAPEQLSGGASEADARTDVYSLGAVLYEILTLERARAPRSLSELRDARSMPPVVPPSRRSPRTGIPHELDAVVAKAMHPDPDGRYQDVAELAADVEAHLAGRRLAAAAYSPWQLALKWSKLHRAKAAAAVGIAVALAAGAVGMVAAGRAAARAEEERALAGRATQAVGWWREGTAAWDGPVGRVAFNPAAPQDWFQARLPPLLAMARALAWHPAPPDVWRSEVAARAAELQRRAEEIGDWALARILAESAASWGAVDPAERVARLEAIASAEREAARRDQERLDEALRRLELALGSDGPRHGSLVPGELEERARRLAASTGPVLTGEILRRLTGSGTPADPTARVFLIELLGRKGDPFTEAGGTTAGRFLSGELDRTGGESVLDLDLLGAIALAAVRLETRSPGALPGLGERLASLDARFEADLPARAAIQPAREMIALLAAGSPLPGPTARAEAFRRAATELGDWAAARVGSGSAYTRLLLGRAAAGASLPAAALAFVYDQLGLHGDVAPPDPERPAFGAIPALREALRALPAGWLSDDRPAAAPEGAWTRSRALAVAAAANLSRLGDPELARELYELRFESGQDSRFAALTAIPMALSSLDGWATPRAAIDHLHRGNLRLERGDPVGALEDFDRALELDPGFVAIRVNRAVARIQVEDWDGAAADCLAALERAPDSASAHLHLGLALFGRGDPRGALREMDRSIELDRRPMALLHRGDLQRYLGDVAAAIEDYTSALELAPNLAEGYEARSTARAAIGDLEGSVEDASRAIELDPGAAWAYEARARARVRLGDAARALDDLGRALEIDPTNAVGIYTARSEARLSLGDLRGAIEDANRAIERDPGYGPAWGRRAQARWMLGDGAGALADMDREIGTVPNDATSRLNRGWLRSMLGDLKGSRADLDRAIELQPAMALAWSRRAIVRQAAGDPEGALADARRAVELDPEDSSCRRDLANVRALQGDLAGAIEDFGIVLAAFPDDLDARASRARARYESGDLAGSLADFELAAAASPDQWRFALWIGVVQAGLGRRAEAAAAFDRALRLAPEGERSGIERTRLQALGR